jgi:hypothetical protein
LLAISSLRTDIYREAGVDLCENLRIARECWYMHPKALDAAIPSLRARRWRE